MLNTIKQKVLVVGGGGYIGSQLVRLLLKKKYAVKVFDNFLFGRKGLEQIDSNDLEIIEGDICNTKDISHAVQGVDAVIMLTAIIGHRSKDISRLNLREINLLASSVVLDAAREHGAARFIFASSDSVYGVQKGVMYETRTPDPVSIYARLKLRMEERVLKAHSSEFTTTVLRVCNCHGYSPRMRFDLVPNALMRDALLAKHIIVEGGEQWRAFINVEDTARAFLSCLEAYPDIIGGEVYNVGDSQQNVQLNYLVNVISSIVPDCAVKFVYSEPDLTDYKVSFTKLEKAIQFSASKTLVESLTELKDAIVSQAIVNPYSSIYQNTL